MDMFDPLSYLYSSASLLNNLQLYIPWPACYKCKWIGKHWEVESIIYTIPYIETTYIELQLSTFAHNQLEKAKKIDYN